MGEFKKAIATTDVEESKAKKVEIDGKNIAIIKQADSFYAISDWCSHADESLSDGGCIEGDEIECPAHFARFNFKSGEVTEPPAFEDIKTYPTKVEDGFVWVEV